MAVLFATYGTYQIALKYAGSGMPLRNDYCKPMLFYTRLTRSSPHIDMGASELMLSTIAS